MTSVTKKVLSVTALRPKARVTRTVTRDAAKIWAMFVPTSRVVMASSKESSTRSTRFARISPRSSATFIRFFETDEIAVSVSAKY